MNKHLDINAMGQRKQKHAFIKQSFLFESIQIFWHSGVTINLAHAALIGLSKICQTAFFNHQVEHRQCNIVCLNVEAAYKRGMGRPENGTIRSSMQTEKWWETRAAFEQLHSHAAQPKSNAGIVINNATYALSSCLFQVR